MIVTVLDLEQLAIMEQITVLEDFLQKVNIAVADDSIRVIVIMLAILII
jgi:hypothetical protein